MGVSHTVLTLLDDPAFVPWLEVYGVVLPQPWPTHRNPSPAEIRAVLDPQPAYRVEYSIGPGLWDAWISTADQQRTAIWVRNFSGDETVPHEFFFHKGSETLNIQILEQLAPVCGPLVLVSDAQGLPMVVFGPGQVVYGQDRPILRRQTLPLANDAQSRHRLLNLRYYSPASLRRRHP